MPKYRCQIHYSGLLIDFTVLIVGISWILRYLFQGVPTSTTSEDEEDVMIVGSSSIDDSKTDMDVNTANKEINNIAEAIKVSQAITDSIKIQEKSTIVQNDNVVTIVHDTNIQPK